jgi:chromosome segregation ATPase
MGTFLAQLNGDLQSTLDARAVADRAHSEQHGLVQVQLQECTAQLERARGESAEHLHKIETLQSQFDTLTCERAVVIAEVQSVRAQLSEAATALLSETNAKRELQAQLVTADSVATALREQLAAQAEHIKSLHEQTQLQSGQLEQRLADERERLFAELQTAKTQLAAATNDVQQLQQRVSTDEQQLTELTSANGALQISLSTLQTERDQLLAAQHTLKSEHDQLVTDLKNVHDQFAADTARHNALLEQTTSEHATLVARLATVEADLAKEKSARVKADEDADGMTMMNANLKLELTHNAKMVGAHGDSSGQGLLNSIAGC